jgi:hypothetical protein
MNIWIYIFIYYKNQNNDKLSIKYDESTSLKVIRRAFATTVGPDPLAIERSIARKDGIISYQLFRFAFH